jgi:hypothetical protein
MATDLASVVESNRHQVPVGESLRPLGPEYLELSLNPSLVRAARTWPRHRRSVRHLGGHRRVRAALWFPDAVCETVARISCTSTVPFREEAGLEIVRTAGQRRKPAA